MAEKNYVVSSIKKITTQYGAIYNANFRLEDLKKIEKRGWVNIIIAERREPSEKGATHYAYENTYEPKEQDNTDSYTEKKDDVPF
tara:strand:+ start:1730 stop:1984 length:255 start_codon:yes stop_codon:yes gene_type:complete